MPFLFSAIEISLFFLGRSIGLSPTSTQRVRALRRRRAFAQYVVVLRRLATLSRRARLGRFRVRTTSHFVFDDASVFLPGKLNFLDLISRSSTR